MRHISSFRSIKFARSARRHRIGKANALHVMFETTAQVIPATEFSREEWRWAGADARGLDLEIVAVVMDFESLLVIHVMPMALRRGR